MSKVEPFNYKISITGDLGSGKSTVCGIISKRIGAEVVSIGSIQRRMAKEKNMTTYEFNHYMETHPEIDDEFDTMLKSYDGVFGKNILFDSRLAWNFVPSAFSVYVTTDLKEAARRVYNANRDNEGYKSVEEAMERLADRRSSEILRYGALYNLNIKDMTNYDLVVDSTTASPEEVVGIILSEAEAHGGYGENRLYLSPSRIYPLSGADKDGELEVFLYNDFYFAVRGTDKLKSAFIGLEPFVACSLKVMAEDEKAAHIAQNYDILYLKQWESVCGRELIRYPLELK